MNRPRVFVLLALLPVLTGVLFGGIVTAGWLIVRPGLAGGTMWLKVAKTGEAHYSGGPTQPVFFLAVGNDGRTGETLVRGDALHLVGVNPAQGSATVIDIPRDTGVPIPGHGVDKVTHAMAFGGLGLEAQVVGELVGVHIPYAITTNFDGFVAMIDEMGGVDIDIPQPMHDEFSGAFFDPGPRHLNGGEALSFSRDRHDFPLDDLKRTENQGYLAISALATLRNQNPGAAGAVNLVATLARHVQLEGVSLVDVYRLGRLALSIDPGRVRNVVAPAVDTGRSTVLSLDPSASALFADFADDAVLQSH